LMKKHTPCKRVLLIDKDGAAGGKLQGPVCREGAPFCQEFAAMRLMKDSSIPYLKEEHDLLVEMGLTLVEVPYTTEGNFFYYNGSAMDKAELKNKSLTPHMPGGGRTPKLIIDSVKEAYQEDYDTTCSKNTWKVGCNPNVLERHDVINQSVTDLFMSQGATMEEFKLWESEYGYAFYNENVSAASWLNMGKLHSTNGERKHQYFLKESWLALPERLLSSSGHEVRLNTEVTQVQKKDTADCRVEVKTKDGSSICAMDVILTSPFGMPDVPSISENRKSAIADTCVHYSHFKAFFTWDNDKVWWRGHGDTNKPNLIGGKSTTDLGIRQVHYYSNDTLLVYPGCCEPADVLGRMMDEDPEAGRRHMFEQIKQMHTPHFDVIPEPNWDKTVYKYFKDEGTSKWRNGVNQVHGMDLILNGQADQTGIWMASDVFSEFPAWIIGSMMSIKKTLALMGVVSP